MKQGLHGQVFTCVTFHKMLVRGSELMDWGKRIGALAFD